MRTKLTLARSLSVCGLALTLQLTAGCSTTSKRSDPVPVSDTSGSPDTSSDPSTTPPPTVPIPTSTPAPAPTSPPTTEPESGELFLRGDGLGTFDFGVAPPALIEAITAHLGRPYWDEVTLYPDEDPSDPGWYTETEGVYSFQYPVGRAVCWAGDFCAYFGGAEPGSKFVGWSYTGPSGAFRTVSGLTLGSRWSDFPSMDVHPLCYIKGGATYNDINLELEAWELRSGADFQWITTTEDGGFETHLPDPAKTTVYFTQAGQWPVILFDDC